MENPEFREIPLSALRNKTREIVSNSLNTCKILLSPEGLRRDYRGLANSANIPPPPNNCLDPTSFVLKRWQDAANPSIADFIQTLQSIDRWDVIDDVIEHIREDVLAYSQRPNQLTPVGPVRTNGSDFDQQIMTIDDVASFNSGREPEFYDAFLLYADEDADFAGQVLEFLEGQCNLKLCFKDRLVGGLSFEHEAIMRLISERCHFLAIIISPSFLKSPSNKFYLNYAQALGIEHQQRKIVPFIYKPVELPQQLRFYARLDYTRDSPFYDFWSRLSVSLRAPQTERRALMPRVTVTELPPSPSELPLERPSDWDCPSKAPKDNLPAIGAGPSCDDKPVSLLGQQPPVFKSSREKKNKKSKLKKLITNIFPSPPTDEPGAGYNLLRGKKKKKKKVKFPES